MLHQQPTYDHGLSEAIIERERIGAQDKLLEVCASKQYGVASIAGESETGKKLQAQVTRIGDRKAGRCMVLCSGASGVGGIFVSHLYSDLLLSVSDLPRDFSLLLVNAVNPDGLVWPPHFLPQKETQKRWQNPILQDVEARFARDGFHHEQRQRELFTGKVRPLGGAAWEERVLKEIYHQFLAQAQVVVSLDIRPSFQTFGKTDLWSCCELDSPNHDVLKKWFRRLQKESLYDFYGQYGKHAAVGPAVFVEKERLIALRVECGTYTPGDILGAGTLGGSVLGGLMSSDNIGESKNPSDKKETGGLFAKDHPYWQTIKKEVQGIWDVILGGMRHFSESSVEEGH